jgi:uncharacterized protein
MSDTTLGGGVLRDAVPASLAFSRGDALRLLGGLLVILGLIGGAYWLHDADGYGAKPSLSLLIGAALGITFARGRFCFFCILRDWIEKRESTGMYAILAALAIGGIGYAIVFGAFLPNSFSGRLPPDAHIGPVSWVLVAAGGAFGIGMALSGACISGHLYRLGEGYSRAPLALLGSLIGFGLGFFTWQSVYLSTLANAPVAWLPATLGYGGALALHLALLAIIAIVLLRFVPAPSEVTHERLTGRRIFELIFRKRWNPLVTGTIVGVLGMVAYFRVEPLGVTSQIGSFARTTLDNAGLLADRLNGLDGFAGCATVIAQTITENGWLIGGLVLGSFAVSIIASRFQMSSITLKSGVTALGGGVLMGWGSMLALGCTVGTLLSGISAFALSGWVFSAAVIGGVWVGLRLKLHE